MSSDEEAEGGPAGVWRMEARVGYDGLSQRFRVSRTRLQDSAEASFLGLPELVAAAFACEA